MYISIFTEVFCKGCFDWSSEGLTQRSVRKIYVAYRSGDDNNNLLVFDKLDDAVRDNSDAHPLFHSDIGFRYTNNSPMECFGGILKRERYYGRRFTDKESLVAMIEEYICYYNNKRSSIHHVRRILTNIGIVPWRK